MTFSCTRLRCVTCHRTFIGQLASAGLLHPTPAVEERLREIADLPLETEELQSLFDEEKQLAEEQRQLDTQVAVAGMQAASAQPDPNAPPKPGKAPPPKPGKAPPKPPPKVKK